MVPQESVTTGVVKNLGPGRETGCIAGKNLRKRAPFCDLVRSNGNGQNRDRDRTREIDAGQT